MPTDWEFNDLIGSDSEMLAAFSRVEVTNLMNTRRGRLPNSIASVCNARLSSSHPRKSASE